MPKIRLPLVLSLAFHLIVLLGISSMIGTGGESFIVELVSSRMPEFHGVGGDPPGPAADLPGPTDRPALSPGSVPSPQQVPLKSGSTSGGGEEEALAPVQEEETFALPEEPSASPDPALSFDRREESLTEERSEWKPPFPSVDGETSGPGSDGDFPGKGNNTEQHPGEEGASGPASGNGSSGMTEASGGGESASGFVMPSPDGRSNPRPRYPEAARAEGREGTALLKVTVLPDGKVGETAVERSSGHADLDRSAVEAVTKWTFLPARRGEAPVAASVRIPVTFALDRP
jgi:TonB family protein